MAEIAVTPLASTIADVLAILGPAAPIAMVGGLAVSARTEPRFTRDVDFVVAAANEAEVHAFVYSLLRSGFTTESVLDNVRHDRLATIRLRRTARAPMLDLLFASCGIEAEVVRDATPMTVLGHQVAVARTGHLIAMKLVARDDKRRPQDVVDLHALSTASDPEEWARAQAAVELITERGFARGRDLRAALAEWHAG